MAGLGQSPVVVWGLVVFLGLVVCCPVPDVLGSLVGDSPVPAGDVADTGPSAEFGWADLLEQPAVATTAHVIAINRRVRRMSIDDTRLLAGAFVGNRTIDVLDSPAALVIWGSMRKKGAGGRASPALPAASAHRVEVSAHRGGAEAATPATMAAYRDALAAGVDYVEFDVCRTRDGELVVFHDKRAERRGVRPSRLTGVELRARAGHEVPDLRDLLVMIRGRAKAHVDIKAPGYEDEVVAAVTEVLAPADFLVTGSDQVVTAVKRRFPEVRAALSVGSGWGEVPLARLVQTRRSELRPVRRARACGADAVAAHHMLVRFGALSACARAGVRVMVWTVNDPRRIRALLRDPRVGVLVTDRPRLALRLRDGEPDAGVPDGDGGGDSGRAAGR